MTTETGSKFFDVARYRMIGDARNEFETMRDATSESDTALVVTESGVSYRVIPRERDDASFGLEDQLSVWGISDHTHTDTGYSRFKGIGDAEQDTVPLRLLGGLFVDRLKDLIGVSV